MRTRFRGIDQRQGMVWRGPAGWAEWSPFLDYDGPELVPWWRAAVEAAEQGWPEPVRDRVLVNSTIPALPPEQAYTLAAAASCGTAKVKVAERGQSLADDLARVEAVRDALGPSGQVRVDANGGWSVDEAETAVRQLARHGLEYVEQPCAQVEELAELRRRLARRGVHVLIAADESIRRVEDPYRVRELEAADVAVLKVQPLGGVRACLEIAERIGLPVVVSSALETSVGIRAGVALAAALPELPYACGLNTVPLLTGDLAVTPLVAQAGELPVTDLVLDEERLARHRARPEVAAFWQARLVRISELARATERVGRG
ncbi:o-succinylbenzoate synthase [uncultured Friedmanniella sp.]|uniref:o-succinylbenzoate synthase n=1 Tax=uncultured Friedmanniella sp. TaxID=335381 RepID=UPI0035C962AD